jgi:hypothetical protein
MTFSVLTLSLALQILVLTITKQSVTIKNLIEQKLYVCFTIVLNAVRAECYHLAHLGKEVLLKGMALYN